MPFLRKVTAYPVIAGNGYMLLECRHVIPLPSNIVYGPDRDGVIREKRMCNQCKKKEFNALHSQQRKSL